MSVPYRWEDTAYAVFPRDMREVAQWVVYLRVPKAGQPGKFDKVPYAAKVPGKRDKAATDDPSTWATFEQAVRAAAQFGYAGIGFVFTKDDPWAGVDLDGCRNPETGELATWALDFIQRLGSYVEVSPSGTGVHVIVQARLPRGYGHRRPYEGGTVEIYEQGRFFTVTGQQVPDTPSDANEANAAIQYIYETVWQDAPYDESRGPAPDTNGRFPTPTYGPTGLPDDEVLERCRTDRDGERFAALYDRGDFSDLDRKGDGATPDWSQADWYIWNKLAFYLGDDPKRIMTLAEQGAHYRHPGNDVLARARRKKWSEPRPGYPTLQQHTIAKILAARTEERIYRGGSTLDTAQPLNVLVEKTLARLTEANDPARGLEPQLFVRGGKLMHIRIDERRRPYVEVVEIGWLRVVADKQVRYVKQTDTPNKGTRRSHVRPPTDVLEGVLAAKDYGLPPLAGITEVPVLRPDGTVLLRPGYDRATGLVYLPPADGSLRLAPVPDVPTDAQVREAWNALHYVFADFPFLDPADRANLMGLLVTLVLRPAIHGHIPLALIDAPTGGTGKGLVVDALALLATGGPAEMLQAATGEDEWRKRITAALLAGRLFTCIDNVEHMLSSEALASMLTALVYEDRILGVSRNAKIPGDQVGVWCATGNNIAVGGTLPRRSYRIRLDARVPNPYLRPASEFRQPRLREYVRANRASLLHALLTVCRAWWARGCPTQGAPTLGNFEQWTETVWGVLSLDPTRAEPVGDNLRCFGSYFLGNGEELWSQGDGDAEDWLPFLQELATHFGGASFTAAQVAKALRAEEIITPLRDALPGALAVVKPENFTFQLGMAFKKRNGTRYGDDMWRIESAEQDAHSKVARWEVRRG